MHALRVARALALLGASASIVSCGNGSSSGTTTTASDATLTEAAMADTTGIDTSGNDTLDAPSSEGATDALSDDADGATDDGEAASDVQAESGNPDAAAEAEVAADVEAGPPQCLARASKGKSVDCVAGRGCQFNPSTNVVSCVVVSGTPDSGACGALWCLDPYCYCIDPDKMICDCNETGGGPLMPPDLPSVV